MGDGWTTGYMYANNMWTTLPSDTTDDTLTISGGTSDNGYVTIDPSALPSADDYSISLPVIDNGGMIDDSSSLTPPELYDAMETLMRRRMNEEEEYIKPKKKEIQYFPTPKAMREARRRR